MEKQETFDFAAANTEHGIFELAGEIYYPERTEECLTNFGTTVERNNFLRLVLESDNWVRLPSTHSTVVTQEQIDEYNKYKNGIIQTGILKLENCLRDDFIPQHIQLDSFFPLHNLSENLSWFQKYTGFKATIKYKDTYTYTLIIYDEENKEVDRTTVQLLEKVTTKD